VFHYAAGGWLTRRRLPAVLGAVLMILLAACQSSEAGPAASSASQKASPAQTGSPAQTAQPAIRALGRECTDTSACHFDAGTYRLSAGTVVPGLEITMPSGWSSSESTRAELSLVPPGQSDDALKFWLDMIPVKSSGAGHGTTILKNVGRTPSALTSWLTHDHDFLIVSKPAPVTIGHGITMTSLAVGVSPSANYSDSGCPSNPRCADLFTSSYWVSSGNFYSIGGDGEVRLYLGTIQLNGSPHTFFVALDAVSHADLLSLDKAASQIIASLRLPAGAVAG
jgi:hypothetical protein